MKVNLKVVPGYKPKLGMAKRPEQPKPMQNTPVSGPMLKLRNICIFGFLLLGNGLAQASTLLRSSPNLKPSSNFSQNPLHNESLSLPGNCTISESPENLARINNEFSGLSDSLKQKVLSVWNSTNKATSAADIFLVWSQIPETATSIRDELLSNVAKELGLDKLFESKVDFVTNIVTENSNHAFVVIENDLLMINLETGTVMRNSKIGYFKEDLKFVKIDDLFLFGDFKEDVQVVKINDRFIYLKSSQGQIKEIDREEIILSGLTEVSLDNLKQQIVEEEFINWVEQQFNIESPKGHKKTLIELANGTPKHYHASVYITSQDSNGNLYYIAEVDGEFQYIKWDPEAKKDAYRVVHGKRRGEYSKEDFLNEHGANNITVGIKDLTRRGNLAIVGRLFNKNTGANLPYSETRLQEPPEGPLKIFYKNYKEGWIPLLLNKFRLGEVEILTKKISGTDKWMEDFLMENFRGLLD